MGERKPNNRKILKKITADKVDVESMRSSFNLHSLGVFPDTEIDWIDLKKSKMSDQIPIEVVPFEDN